MNTKLRIRSYLKGLDWELLTIRIDSFLYTLFIKFLKFFWKASLVFYWFLHSQNLYNVSYTPFFYRQYWSDGQQLSLCLLKSNTMNLRLKITSYELWHVWYLFKVILTIFALEVGVFIHSIIPWLLSCILLNFIGKTQWLFRFIFRQSTAMKRDKIWKYLIFFYILRQTKYFCNYYGERWWLPKTSA